MDPCISFERSQRQHLEWVKFGSGTVAYPDNKHAILRSCEQSVAVHCAHTFNTSFVLPQFLEAPRLVVSEIQSPNTDAAILGSGGQEHVGLLRMHQTNAGNWLSVASKNTNIIRFGAWLECVLVELHQSKILVVATARNERLGHAGNVDTTHLFQDHVSHTFVMVQRKQR